jgi:hypothetical protein
VRWGRLRDRRGRGCGARVGRTRRCRSAPWRRDPLDPSPEATRARARSGGTPVDRPCETVPRSPPPIAIHVTGRRMEWEDPLRSVDREHRLTRCIHRQGSAGIAASLDGPMTAGRWRGWREAADLSRSLTAPVAGRRSGRANGSDDRPRRVAAEEGPKVVTGASLPPERDARGCSPGAAWHPRESRVGAHLGLPGTPAGAAWVLTWACLARQTRARGCTLGPASHLKRRRVGAHRGPPCTPDGRSWVFTRACLAPQRDARGCAPGAALHPRGKPARAHRMLPCTREGGAWVTTQSSLPPQTAAHGR